MTEQEIHNILFKLGIKKYKITKDNTVNVYQDVVLINIDKIPVNFNYVGGNFYCRFSKLTNLIGCPRQTTGYIYASNNPLKSLDGYEGDYNNLICDNKDKLIRKHKLKKFLNDSNLYI